MEKVSSYGWMNGEFVVIGDCGTRVVHDTEDELRAILADEIIPDAKERGLTIDELLENAYHHRCEIKDDCYFSGIEIGEGESDDIANEYDERYESLVRELWEVSK